MSDRDANGSDAESPETYEEVDRRVVAPGWSLIQELVKGQREDNAATRDVFRLSIADLASRMQTMSGDMTSASKSQTYILVLALVIIGGALGVGLKFTAPGFSVDSVLPVEDSPPEELQGSPPEADGS